MTASNDGSKSKISHNFKHYEIAISFIYHVKSVVLPIFSMSHSSIVSKWLKNIPSVTALTQFITQFIIIYHATYDSPTVVQLLHTVVVAVGTHLHLTHASRWSWWLEAPDHHSTTHCINDDQAWTEFKFDRDLSSVTTVIAPMQFSSTLNRCLSSDQILIGVQLCSCMYTSQKSWSTEALPSSIILLSKQT